MLLIFIAMAFIASPVITMLVINPWGRGRYIWVFNLLQVLNVLSLIPFLVFVGSAKRYFSAKQTKPTQRTPIEQTKGPVWNTDLNKSQIKQVSTQRNLAFVIDCLPSMVASVGSFYLSWILASWNIAQGFGTLLSIGMFCFAIASIVYLLMKDAFGGQSIGKRLLGCRVVSSETGRPVGPVESFLRNLAFFLPFMVPVELIVSKVRADGKRVGDLWAKTRVVAGPPQWVDGLLVVQEETQKKHALDD